MQPGQRGFTVVEVIAVLLVVAVLAASALPRLSGRSALQEHGFRDRLDSMIDDTRRLAVAQQRDVCVLISATQARAVYVAAGACSPALPVAAPAGRSPYVLQVPAGASVGGGPALRFDPRGQPVPEVEQALGPPGPVIGREAGIVR